MDSGSQFLSRWGGVEKRQESRLLPGNIFIKLAKSTMPALSPMSRMTRRRSLGESSPQDRRAATDSETPGDKGTLGFVRDACTERCGKIANFELELPLF